MISVFLDAVLPVAALIGVGYAFARFGLFDTAMASAINRFVFMLAVPALLFRLISGVDFSQFEWRLLLGYLAVEVTVYAAGFAVARFAYGRPALESLMIGMAATFPNHVYQTRLLPPYYPDRFSRIDLPIQIVVAKLHRNQME